MRKTIVFVGVAASAVLITLWVLPRRPPAVRIRPPVPTADEEAGGASGALEPAVRPAPRVQEAVPPPTRADDIRPRVRQEPAAGVQDTAPTRSDPVPEERSPMAGARGREEGTVSVPDEDRGQGRGPMEVAQAEAPDRTPVLTPPVLISQGVLAYPADGYRLVLDRDVLTPRLRLDAAQGQVVLRILVRPDGTVGRVEVAETSGTRVLDDAAVRTATGWAFAPATRDGEPIEAWVLIPVRFVVP